MKTFAYMRFAVLAVVFLGVGTALAESDTEPPLGLPLISTTATTSSATAVPVTTYQTIVPSATATANQQAVDDAETGSEIVILSVLSLVSGIGLFLIKKYFDIKRYSL